ncbi:MAG: dephospho-CoA kinase [Clostridiaceae bacterium]|jgi:dephospho-CoA kinase|nr:dephospho-CoA kinase [Clostridiaceae bacterium]
MIKVALTGNIAAGKSTVQKYLVDKGYKTLDTDEVASELRISRKDDIVAAYSGLDIQKSSGEISRVKLAHYVFGHPERVKYLANLMHPWIREEIYKFFDKNKSEDIVFVGIPLVFESHLENDYDKIIMIYTDDEIRLQRLIKRNGYDVDYAKRRMSSQMSQNEKVAKSDFVVYNNSSRSEVFKQIDDILVKLKPERIL